MDFRNMRHFALMMILQVQVCLLAEAEAALWQARCLRGGMGVDTTSSQQLAQPMMDTAWKPPKVHCVNQNSLQLMCTAENAIDVKPRSMAICVHPRLSRCLIVVACVLCLCRWTHCRVNTASVFHQTNA